MVLQVTKHMHRYLFQQKKHVNCGWNYFKWHENDEVQPKIQTSHIFKCEKIDVEITLNNFILNLN